MPHFEVAGCRNEVLSGSTQAADPLWHHTYTLPTLLTSSHGIGLSTSEVGQATTFHVTCSMSTSTSSWKYIIGNMGSNLTESALQRAARSVTTLHEICLTFDAQSNVPCRTRHNTRSDRDDVKKVVSTVLTNKLLVEMGQREHKSFKDIKLNPLHKWNVEKTEVWIKAKIKEYEKYQGSIHSEVSESGIDCPLTDDL